MLKDSMVVDPTGKQFREMLAYAKQMLPNIIVPHDGEALEPDSSKWDWELMNRELAQLVENFSNERIDHLLRVVQMEMAETIRRREDLKAAQQCAQPQRSSSSKPSRQPMTTNTKLTVSLGKKRPERKKALSDMQKANKEIERILLDSKRKDCDLNQWQLDELEKFARNILDSAEQYRKGL